MSANLTIWDKIKNFAGGQILTTADEIQRLIPDSVLFGSIFLYVLTQNISYGVFAIFMLESSTIYKIITWMFSQTSGVSRSLTTDMLLKCRPGYRTPRYEVDRMFSKNAYPSQAVFSIISMASYLGMSMGTFKETMQTMGPEWASRYAVAVSFITVFVGLIVVLRLLRGCESIGEILIAALFGLISGLLFFYINKSLFGKESVNFLGLPFVVEKDKDGTPIYVCAAEATDNKN